MSHSPERTQPAPAGPGPAIAAWTDHIASAVTVGEFGDHFYRSICGQDGVLDRLVELLKTCARWCHATGIHQSADELTVIAQRIADTHDELGLVADHILSEFLIRAQQRATAQAAVHPSSSANHTATSPTNTSARPFGPAHSECAPSSGRNPPTPHRTR